MSEWADRIEASPVWDRVLGVRAQVEQITVTPEDAPEVASDLVRLKTVLDSTEEALRASDPLLLTPGPLASIDSALQQLSTELTAFETDRGRGHLANANAHADSILSSLAQFQFAQRSSADTVEALETVRKRSEQTLTVLLDHERSLGERLGQLDASVQAATQEISAQKGRLDAAIAEYQQQFSTAESARQNQVAEALKAHSQRLDQALADSQKLLLDSQQEATKRLEALLEKINERADTYQKGVEKSGTDFVAQLDAFRVKAENLLHVIGSLGMAGEYQKAANSGRRGAIVWQAIAAFSMVGLIFFAVLAYSAAQADEIRWGSVATRAFVTVTFGILAAYAARQADRYGEVEVVNRRYQLELSSIDPYLANLPAEKQREVKVELAKKLFGNPLSVLSNSPSSPKQFSATGKDPLELALSIILEVVKKR